MFQLIEVGLRAKFGEEAMELAPAIHKLNDAETYLALNRVIVNAAHLDEVRRAYTKAAAALRRKKAREEKRGSPEM